jgi:tryptophan synthase alpha chain
MVREFRKESQTPIVLFGAYNPFFHYGLERFAKDAAAAGADGILIPDLPADEGSEAEPAVRAAGLELIYLIAPTTPLERKRMICSRAGGFIYYISLKGVTGARASLQHDLEKPLAEIRECTKLPVAVGFGISTPAQAAVVAKSADAVVVGSALIDLISKNRNSPGLNGVVEAYMRSMKDSISANGKS